ncbi:hypothetical protein M419DRAFT_117021 [Trichoderma reesei RUT C-30]|uniref:Uncharacterized protein n=1 Tax=Hypocrea jecorina (strain ATCC 56765 / BCRC 32924 / NRRL 11460 / Rut C-30) TaxID=1344414 RepID=A0A024SMS4_HYPJR|nr:hypothetical protein M419DRAFT_117021 [Trichoderma reesei RUT C-30]
MARRRGARGGKKASLQALPDTPHVLFLSQAFLFFDCWPDTQGCRFSIARRGDNS